MNATQDAGMMAMVVNIAPILLIFVLFYFLMIRPQQKRMKQHQEMVKALKRGDEVVLSNGMVGKVTRVEETEAMIDIAQGVSVRVVRTMIAEVRNRTAIAANDKG